MLVSESEQNMTAPYYLDLAGGTAPISAWRNTVDGIRIRVAAWPVENSKGTIYLLPGRTEYIEKYAEVVQSICDNGFSCLCVDWRGQGLSDRLDDDILLGHVRRIQDYQHDLDALMEFAQEQGLTGPNYMIAHSLGGAIGYEALQRGLPFEAATFTGPMWGIAMSWFFKNFALIIGKIGIKLGMCRNYAPGTNDKSILLREDFPSNTLTTYRPAWDRMLSHVKSVKEFALGGPSYRWVYEAIKTTRDLEDTTSPQIPVLTFVGENERIVDIPAIRARMQRWPNGKFISVVGAEHEILMESPETVSNVLAQSLELFRKAKVSPSSV